MNQKASKEELAKRLINFSVEIMILSNATVNKHPVTKIAFQQLIRSSSSIGANVTEAHGSQTSKEFKRFLSIALRSSRETKYWLVVLKTYFARIKSKKEVSILNNLLDEVTAFIKILSKSVSTLNKKC